MVRHGHVHRESDSWFTSSRRILCTRNVLFLDSRPTRIPTPLASYRRPCRASLCGLAVPHYVTVAATLSPSHIRPTIITTTTPCHVPAQPVYLVNLGVCKPVAWVREHIRHADVLSLVFAVLAEALAGNHHGHRRLGDQVVTERAKQHTAMVSFMRFASTGSTYPFRALRPLEPRMTSVGSSMSICKNDLSACIPKEKWPGLVSETYHFGDHVLGALAVEDLHHHPGLQAGLLQ
jgi:hypothetical protein